MRRRCSPTDTRSSRAHCWALISQVVVSSRVQNSIAGLRKKKSSLRKRFHDPAHSRVFPVLDLHPMLGPASLIGAIPALRPKPSSPIRRAARNRSGPISPGSNRLTNIPFGLRANSLSRLALRIGSGCFLRSSSPSTRISKAHSCTFSFCFPECSALKPEMPSTLRITPSSDFRAPLIVSGSHLANRPNAH
jgi:hypothetical protein